MGRAAAGRRGRRGRGQQGAGSQRLLLALAASALLTAAVSLPMAYQAREGRSQDGGSTGPRTEVLGNSTVRTGAADASTLFRRTADGVELLHRATVPEPVQILLDAPGVVRADFRIDNGPVLTDEAAPYEYDDGRPVELGPGAHSVTVTATDASGTATLHQAFFTVAE